MEETPASPGIPGPGEQPGRFAPAMIEGLAPESLAALMSLVEPDSLDAANAVGALEAIRRLSAWTAAYQAKIIHRLHQQVSGELSPVFGEKADAMAFTDTATEVGCALRLPERSAAALVYDSCVLVDQFSPTLAALSEGEFSYGCAQTIIGEAEGLPTEAMGAYERELLTVAPGLTRAKLGGKARRLRELRHPESMKTRRTKAGADRCVYVRPDRDGMAWLNAYLPAENAIAAFNRIDAAAKTLQNPTEVRTLTQLRADVLSALLIHTGSQGRRGPQTSTGSNGSGAGGDDESGRQPRDANDEMPTMDTTSGGGADTGAGTGSGITNAGGAGALSNFDYRSNFARDLCGIGGIRAEVIVTVPVLTLMGLSETPGSLEGYGPIPADIARELAATAPSFLRLLTHPETGATLSVGRDRYKPPKDLRNALRVRDKTCRFPGCSRSAWKCELDHTDEWGNYGYTEYINLSHLCKRHHMLKHRTDWKVTQGSAGRLDWTSPRGISYTTRPDDLPVDLAPLWPPENSATSKPSGNGRNTPSNDEASGPGPVDDAPDSTPPPF